MKYTWLMFDADGTLFDYDRAETVALEAAFAQFGIVCDEYLLSSYRRVNGRLWQEFEQGAMSQQKLKSERFRRLGESLGMDLDHEKLSTLYLSFLAQGTFLIESAGIVLEALFDSYQLALITNGLKDVQRPRLAASSIQDYFTTIIISEEVGVAKPDSKIFEVAFEKMNQPNKEQVLIIGDSLSSDITGGINYGIDVCWYNPSEESRPTNLDIQYEIRALTELLDML